MCSVDECWGAMLNFDLISSCIGALLDVDVEGEKESILETSRAASFHVKLLYCN